MASNLCALLLQDELSKLQDKLERLNKWEYNEGDSNSLESPWLD